MTLPHGLRRFVAVALLGLTPLALAGGARAPVADAASSAGLPTFTAFSPWSSPVNLGPPVNTHYEESAAAVSADGLSLYFNRNFNGSNPDQPGKVDEDIYVAQRTNRHAAWGDPMPLDALNTTSHERNATVSRDGRLLFFSSNRTSGGIGGLDLYVSHRIENQPIAPSGWSAPINLGALINSAVDDVGPAIFQNPDGTGVLYFTSNRPGRGGFDIYASGVGADGSFGVPLLVGELSSASNEARTAIRADGLEAVFHSNRPPSVLADLWVSTRSTVLDPWGAPTSLGSVVNSTVNDRQPALSDDGELLLFASNRVGLGSLGSDDIWMSERDCTEGPNSPVTDADGDGTGDACDPTPQGTSPPEITVPATVIVDATSPDGATVTYTVTVTDDIPPAPLPVCTPAAGSLFAIADTTVACTAIDAGGNTGNATFVVTVLGAKAQLAALIRKVVDSTSLPAAVKTQLIASLQSVVNGFDPSRPLQRAIACLTLRAFATLVPYVAPPAQAAVWKADALRIRTVLAC